MTTTVRKPILHLSELAVDDTVVRKSTDERYRVLAVTPGHVILAHPTSPVERVRDKAMILRAYEVERPEVLPAGLERITDSEFRFQDWAGDTARVLLTREATGPIVSITGHGSSVHFGPDALRFLAEQSDAREADRLRTR